jgi:hypothetical protein
MYMYIHVYTNVLMYVHVTWKPQKVKTGYMSVIYLSYDILVHIPVIYLVYDMNILSD